MTDKEAMAIALDALETLMIERGSIYEKAIAALKERLAQPEQEPVACVADIDRLQRQMFLDLGYSLSDPLYAIPPQRTEQEPVQEPLTFAGLAITEIRLPKGMTSRFEGGVLVIEAAHGIKEGDAA